MSASPGIRTWHLLYAKRRAKRFATVLGHCFVNCFQIKQATKWQLNAEATHPNIDCIQQCLVSLIA
jgi:hypothetical protein